MKHRREFLSTASKSLALASLAGTRPTASAAPPKGKSEVDPVTGRRRGVGLIAVDHQRSAGGYTLFTPQTDNGNVYLIDIDGAIAHRWKMPNRPGRHAVLLRNGNLGYNGSHPDSPMLYPMWSVWHGGAFSEVTPAGKTVWEFEDVTHHHDAEWLANGNLLYGAAEPLPKDIARRVGGSGAGNLALTAAHGNDGRGAGFIDSEAGHAGLQDRKCKIRRVDLVSFIVVELQDPHQQSADR